MRGRSAQPCGRGSGEGTRARRVAAPPWERAGDASPSLAGARHGPEFFLDCDPEKCYKVVNVPGDGEHQGKFTKTERTIKP